MLREGESIIQLKSYSAEGKRKGGEEERQMEKDTKRKFLLSGRARVAQHDKTARGSISPALGRGEKGGGGGEEQIGSNQESRKGGVVKGQSGVLSRPRWAKKIEISHLVLIDPLAR